MAVAEIVTIGTELLLGEIQDTNSRYIARFLRDIGVDLYRLSTVGDNVQRITATLQEALMRADIVITTGGLGPTVDDPTRQAVAKTFNVPLEFHEELWEQILERYKQYGQKPTENNKRQAYIPANSIPIPNPVGTAPAFAFELGPKVVISLPGVPREMEYLIEHFVRDYLKRRYGLQETVIKPWVIHTISKGESNIDEIIGDLEELSNPTVGLLAHPGQTDIRVTAKASSLAEAEQMMAPVLQRIREQLGKYIYGENDTTLEEAVGRLIADRHVSVEIIEVGTKGEILSKLKSQVSDLANGEFIDSFVSNETLKTLLKESQVQQNADLALGVRLVSNGDKQDLLLVLRGEEIIKEGERSYGGPPGDGQIWAVNSALDYIRRYLIEN
ncbi:MAG TPA: molybdopterin-binding protein [Anaerolineaceae bacterium]|nr:competence/damage-inducible protein A [Anaerolineaceae bacterium]HUM49345.1 molybdopterin-binding protein [Anaerolineaceae bacterium]